MSFARRDFLRLCAGASAAALSGRLWAASGDARFLLVFLRGGYDAANLLVPSSSFYQESRPNIAVPREARLALDSDWGLHPALRDSIGPLLARKEVAFVPFAGTDDLSRSHFETQDAIELGQPEGARKDYGSGFMNRLAGALGSGSAVTFTGATPLAFRGEARVTGASLRFAGRAGLEPRQAKLVEEMYRDSPQAAPVAEGFAMREKLAAELGHEMEAAGRNAPNARNFELEARAIGRLMRSSYSIGFVDVGGWDTHVGEGGAEGQLANRLQQLGGGLAAFADEMGAAWRNTVVAVVSEFGRTWRENGNRGTDHGHGSAYWFLGGAVRGGRVAGAQQRLERGTLFQDRDYPVLTDYRALLGGVFARLYALEPAQLERIFPGAKPEDLQLV